MLRSSWTWGTFALGAFVALCGTAPAGNDPRRLDFSKTSIADKDLAGLIALSPDDRSNDDDNVEFIAHGGGGHGGGGHAMSHGSGGAWHGGGGAWHGGGSAWHGGSSNWHGSTGAWHGSAGTWHGSTGAWHGSAGTWHGSTGAWHGSAGTWHGSWNGGWYGRGYYPYYYRPYYYRPYYYPTFAFSVGLGLGPWWGYSGGPYYYSYPNAYAYGSYPNGYSYSSPVDGYYSTGGAGAPVPYDAGGAPGRPLMPLADEPPPRRTTPAPVAPSVPPRDGNFPYDGPAAGQPARPSYRYDGGPVAPVPMPPAGATPNTPSGRVVKLDTAAKRTWPAYGDNRTKSAPDDRMLAVTQSTK